MSDDNPLCPICDTPVTRCWHEAAHANFWIHCPACGTYCLDSFVRDLGGLKSFGAFWTAPRRAALSHFIRTRRNLPSYDPKEGRPYVGRDEVQRFESEGLSLPSRLVQIDNLIRCLGDEEANNGEVLEDIPDGIWAVVGAAGHESLANLVRDMKAEGLLADSTSVDAVLGGPTEIVQARLSIEGWRRWEAIHEGDARSLDGFIAMQFGDARLDAFVRDVIQVGVRKGLGVEVHRGDSPGATKAGLIDNIMREQIEDAAFVLVELSHGNEGAYWEAGLAEGLRKPVIYLCEQRVWDDPKTRPHFDVNHRTTIMWDEAEPQKFLDLLVATIKNSVRISYRWGKDKAG